MKKNKSTVSEIVGSICVTAICLGYFKFISDLFYPKTKRVTKVYLTPNTDKTEEASSEK